jgi:hypothetical protein
VKLFNEFNPTPAVGNDVVAVTGQQFYDPVFDPSVSPGVAGLVVEGPYDSFMGYTGNANNHQQKEGLEETRFLVGQFLYPVQVQVSYLEQVLYEIHQTRFRGFVFVDANKVGVECMKNIVNIRVVEGMVTPGGKRINKHSGCVHG